MNNLTHPQNQQHQVAYLSVKSLANRYELSVPTIWRFLRDGLIPKPLKIGGSTRWLLDDLIKFEATQEVK
jgi:predicted DNA-binding transcriptional regulator AlpA